MRFGTYHVFQCSPGKAPARVVAEEIARAELAEALGFDDIWLPEQHFSPYCLAATRSSSPGTWPRVRAASGSAPRRKPMDVNAFALHMPPEGHPLRKERTDPLCFRWCIGDGRRARRPRRSPPARCGRSSTAVPPSRQNACTRAGSWPRSHARGVGTSRSSPCGDDVSTARHGVSGDPLGRRCQP